MSRPKAATTAKPVPMTAEAVARIYKAASNNGGGKVPAGGFESRAARAAALNQRDLKQK